MADTITSRCSDKGLQMTPHRRIIAEVLEMSDDHPDVEELHQRAQALDASISIASVYSTVKLFEEAGILDKLEFGDGRARYEDAEREHHAGDGRSPRLEVSRALELAPGEHGDGRGEQGRGDPVEHARRERREGRRREPRPARGPPHSRLREAAVRARTSRTAICGHGTKRFIRSIGSV